MMYAKSAIGGAMLAVLGSTVAWAEDCKGLSDSTARLACYDKAETAPKSGKPAEPLTVTVVDPDDLMVAHRKYANKAISLKKVRCLYADAGDFRCVTSANVTIFSRSVQPESAQSYVEANCGTFKKMMNGNKCVMNIYFTFDNHDVREDLMDGYEKRKVIRPAAGVNVLFEADVVRRDRR